MNSVALVGRLTRDVELKTVGEYQVAKFSLAVDAYKGKEKSAMFIDCQCWGKTAEVVDQYAKKGDRLGVEGSLVLDTWDDKTSGQKRQKHYINVNRIDLFGSKKEQDDSAQAADAGVGGGEEVPF